MAKLTVTITCPSCRHAAMRIALRQFVTMRYRAGLPFLSEIARIKFSLNAVEVRLHNGAQAGYVPEDIAVELAPLLDQPRSSIATSSALDQGGAKSSMSWG